MAKIKNTPKNVQTLITEALKAQGLTRVPTNKDTNASGTYKSWSAEQRNYNEQVVKPFRLNIARATYDEIFTLVAKYAMTPEDITMLDSLMHDGLEYFEKCPEVFKAHEARKPAKSADMNAIIEAIIKNTGMTREQAQKLVSVEA